MRLRNTRRYPISHRTRVQVIPIKPVQQIPVDSRPRQRMVFDDFCKKLIKNGELGYVALSKILQHAYFNVKRLSHFLYKRKNEKDEPISTALCPDAHALWTIKKKSALAA